MKAKWLFMAVAVAGMVLALDSAARAVNIQRVTVGNPGNAPDYTGYGAVAYTYCLGKYEVTTGQYCEFLNAVAATDDYIYVSDMVNLRLLRLAKTFQAVARAKIP